MKKIMCQYLPKAKGSGCKYRAVLSYVFIKRALLLKVLLYDSIFWSISITYLRVNQQKQVIFYFYFVLLFFLVILVIMDFIIYEKAKMGPLYVPNSSFNVS